ncbi:hypothetical protein ACPA9J_33915 [Pseudomonas aeruginosa]
MLTAIYPPCHRAGGAELLHRPLAFGDAHPRPGDAGFLAFGVLDALKAAGPGPGTSCNGCCTCRWPNRAWPG